jgi:enterochelin esterase-like enzyme
MPGLALTGLGLVVALALATVGATIATVCWWERWRRLPRTRRVIALLVCQLLAFTTVAVMVNRQVQLYSSWSDLMGNTGTVSTSAEAHGRLDHYVAIVASREQGSAIDGVVIPWTVTGGRSGLTLPAEVYLPGAYLTGQGQHQRFPVIEFFDGFPGSPQSWLRTLALKSVLDREINAGRMAPAIAVLPTQNVNRLRDSECVNPAQGPQLDTYLTIDLRAALSRDFRIDPDRQGWASIGYSTGGYCAVNLALRHPDLYTAAASMSGYFYPATDTTTGDLYRGSRRLQQANDPQWRLRHQPTDVALYLAAPFGDLGAVRQAHQMAAAARAGRSPLMVTTAIRPGGGHNFTSWQALLPAALDWLSAHLVAPLAPPLSPRLQPTPTGTTRPVQAARPPAR